MVAIRFDSRCRRSSFVIREARITEFCAGCIPQAEGWAHGPTDQNKDSPITFCLTAAALWGALDQRRSRVHLFAEALSHVFEPIPRIHAVDDPPQKAQTFPDVVAIVPDIFFRDLGI
jgi:hypothetical protein